MLFAAPALLVVFAFAWSRFAIRRGEWQRLHHYWIVFGVSVVFSTLSMSLGDRLGIASPAVAILGSATCGTSWLLARELFRPAGSSRWWPHALVAALVGTRAVGLLLGTPAAAAGAEWLPRIAGNVHELTSSAVLLLAMVEAIDGYRRNLPSIERRFRQGFLAVYGLLLTIAVLWLRQGDAATADWQETVKVVCASAAFLAGTAAVWFRAAHPLPPEELKPRVRARAATEEDRSLGQQVLALLERERVFTQPELKVADVARMLDEPEYRVTQCITGALGFRNFNRLVNRYRVEHAKQMLADTRHNELSILAIAMDSGFASIGPFNRAFKEEAGMTPGAYRAERRLRQDLGIALRS